MLTAMAPDREAGRAMKVVPSSDSRGVPAGTSHGVPAGTSRARRSSRPADRATSQRARSDPPDAVAGSQLDEDSLV
jgi:hypothetical protein